MKHPMTLRIFQRVRMRKNVAQIDPDISTEPWTATKSAAVNEQIQADESSRRMTEMKIKTSTLSRQETRMLIGLIAKS